MFLVLFLIVFYSVNTYKVGLFGFMLIAVSSVLSMEYLEELLLVTRSKSVYSQRFIWGTLFVLTTFWGVGIWLAFLRGGFDGVSTMCVMVLPQSLVLSFYSCNLKNILSRRR